MCTTTTTKSIYQSTHQSHHCLLFTVNTMFVLSCLSCLIICTHIDIATRTNINIHIATVLGRKSYALHQAIAILDPPIYTPLSLASMVGLLAHHMLHIEPIAPQKSLSVLDGPIPQPQLLYHRSYHRR